MVQCVTIICKRGSNTLFLHFVFFFNYFSFDIKKKFQVLFEVWV